MIYAQWNGPSETKPWAGLGRSGHSNMIEDRVSSYARRILTSLADGRVDES